MEYRRGEKTAGLVRGAGLCVCRAVRADGKDAQSGAAEESALPRAGGYHHCAATRWRAAHQWHAANHRNTSAVRRFSVLSDDVSQSLSEWGCFLSLRAAAEGGRQPDEGWLAAENFRARPDDLWRYSSVPGDLLLVRERAFALLRERLLGIGGGFHPLKRGFATR